MFLVVFVISVVVVFVVDLDLAAVVVDDAIICDARSNSADDFMNGNVGVIFIYLFIYFSKYIIPVQYNC